MVTKRKPQVVPAVVVPPIPKRTITVDQSVTGEWFWRLRVGTSAKPSAGPVETYVRRTRMIEIVGNVFALTPEQVATLKKENRLEIPSR